MKDKCLRLMMSGLLCLPWLALEAQAEPADDNWSDLNSGRIVLYEVNRQLYAKPNGQPVPVTVWGKAYTTMALRWIGHQDGWDILENLDPKVKGQHVLSPTVSLSDFAHFRLQLAALAKSHTKVLAKTLRVRRADGSEMIVLPGVPVYQKDKQWFFSPKVYGRSLNHHPVPQAHIGRYFQPSRLDTYMTVEKHQYCGVDNGLLQENETCFTPTSESSEISTSDVRDAYRIRKEDGKIWGLIKRKDWLYEEIELKERSEHGKKKSETVSILGALGSVWRGRSDYKVHKGAAVYWPDGTVAGRVRKAHSLDKRQLVENDGRQCTVVPWSNPEQFGGFGGFPVEDSIPPISICYLQKTFAPPDVFELSSTA